jgi:hypothetical protein
VEAERQTKRDEETVEWRMRSRGKEREMTDKRWEERQEGGRWGWEKRQEGGTADNLPNRQAGVGGQEGRWAGRQVGRKAGGQEGKWANQEVGRLVGSFGAQGGRWEGRWEGRWGQLKLTGQQGAGQDRGEEPPEKRGREADRKRPPSPLAPPPMINNTSSNYSSEKRHDTGCGEAGSKDDVISQKYQGER